MNTISLIPESANTPLYKKPSATNSVEIKSVDTKNISEGVLLELSEVVEDMWASSGIKEFVNCESCNKTFSKHDIFGHFPIELYQKTVRKILGILGKETINCPCCCGPTTFMYHPHEYIDTIRDKYRNSVDAFLTIVRDDEGHIIGFSEGYVDSLENLLLRRDIGDHYANVGLPVVKESVDRILSTSPHFVFLISAIGLLESHMNPFILINLLHTFTKDIPEKYNFTPGIMELEKGHILYVVSETLGAVKSGISYENELSVQEKKYKSDLLVFKNPILLGKERFGGGMLQFLRRNKKARAIKTYPYNDPILEVA